MPRLSSVLGLPEQVPGRQQIETWRDTVSPLWNVTVPAENADRFKCASEVFHLSTSILGNTAATAHRTERSPSLIAMMGVDHILVQLRLSGQAEIVADGHEGRLGAGDIAFLDMSRPLSTHNVDYRAVTLALPRRLWAAVKDLDELHGTILRGNSPLGHLAAGHLRALSTQAGRLSPEEAVAVVEGTVALLAACVAPRTGPLRPAEEPATLILLRRFIETNLASPDLSAELLTQRFGLSRSVLYRLFKPADGVATYVRRRRLAHAYREFATATPRRPPRVQEVGFRFGFESPAHFVQAFRREFGCTPSEVRAAAVARTSHAPVPELSSRAGLFAWVMELTA